jgi:hypothetical protein
MREDLAADLEVNADNSVRQTLLPLAVISVSSWLVIAGALWFLL